MDKYARLLIVILGKAAFKYVDQISEIQNASSYDLDSHPVTLFTLIKTSQ